MKKLNYTFIVLLLTWIGCKKEDTTSVTNENTKSVPFTQMPTTTAAIPPVANATSSNSVYVGKEDQKESVMYQYKYTAVKNTTASATTTVTPAGMNPPHGQPKHRCDLPVGAPLNTAATKTTTPAKTTTVVSTPVITNAANSVPPLLATTPEAAPTPEGMNPPHGQAKHRCDIAVGAALPKE